MVPGAVFDPEALPSHPAALALLENIGLLHMGLRGTFRFPYFLRYIHEKEEAKLTKLNENKKDELQWGFMRLGRMKKQG